MDAKMVTKNSLFCSKQQQGEEETEDRKEKKLDATEVSHCSEAAKQFIPKFSARKLGPSQGLSSEVQ